MEPKKVAFSGSSSRPLKHALTGKPFCQTVYQNRFSSTGGTVHGAEAKKNGFTSEVKPCQTGPKKKERGLEPVQAQHTDKFT